MRRRWRCCCSSGRWRWAPSSACRLFVCRRITNHVNFLFVFDLNRFVPIRPRISFPFLSHETFGHGVIWMLVDGGWQTRSFCCKNSQVSYPNILIHLIPKKNKLLLLLFTWIHTINKSLVSHSLLRENLFLMFGKKFACCCVYVFPLFLLCFLLAWWVHKFSFWFLLFKAATRKFSLA